MALSALPVPDPQVRAVTDADTDEMERLFTLAAAELADRKGAWLWERADSPFSGPVEAARAATAPAGSSSHGAHQGDEGSHWFTTVGLIDNVIVGFLLAEQITMHRDGDLGVVRGLYVEPDGRGIGVADALILDALERFKAAGCVGVDSWALPGERETKNFYEAHGFTARTITVHHSFIEPKHLSKTAVLGKSESAQTLDAT